MSAMKRLRLALIGSTLVIGLAFAALLVSLAMQRVTLEGGISMTGPSTAAEPLVGNLGALTNDSPWPVRITGAGEDGELFGPAIGFGVFRGEPTTNTNIDWIEPEHSIELASGDTVYLAFSVTVEGGRPQGFASVDVHYRDIVGRDNSVSAPLGMLGFPPGLPEGIASLESAVDSEGFDLFLQALRVALGRDDPDAVVPFLGLGATRSDAVAFLAQQEDVDETFGSYSTPLGESSAEVAYWLVSSEDARPTFTVSWADNRWSAQS